MERITLEDLAKWIGAVGWVRPRPRTKTATIAVRVTGVKFGYGRHMLKVEPLMGTGYWYVYYKNVSIDKDALI